MKVSVIGVGYLGAVHATALAHLGFQVVGVDVDESKVELLAAGHPPFHEPGFADLLTHVTERGDLTFTTEMAAAVDADVHFLCVGTPQLIGSHAADLTYVWAAVRALGMVARPDSVIVGKSTVPVGTASDIQNYLDEQFGDAAPTVVWNPEFLREGFAVADSLSPDRIVVGIPERSADQTAALLRRLYADQIEAGIPYLETDLATAELVKVAANAFLATKISFINAMAEVCEAVSADVVTLADAIGHDARIGRRFLNAGVGFGGGCLPKDIRAFAARADELGVGEAVSFLTWADSVNLRRRQAIVDGALELCGGTVTDRRIALLGAAFKPDSDDVRDSPGLWIAQRLTQLGATVVVHDPQALAGVRRTHPHLSTSPDLITALTGSELVILATEWQEYADLDPVTVGNWVERPCIIDGRNVLDSQAWRRSGWIYRGMGREARDSMDLRRDWAEEVPVAVT